MNRYIHTTLKMSIACVITILISNLIGLTYAITAGILAVLSIQLTRTDSIHMAIKRLINATFGLLLATLFFVLLGYQIYVFLIYVFIFIGLSFLLKLPEGIVPTLVLASHLLLFGSFSLAFLGEEFLMIGIAVGVALLLNIFYPLNSLKAFSQILMKTDQAMKDHVLMLSFLLKDIEHPEDYLTHYGHMNTIIKQMIKNAQLIDKDILFDNDHRLMRYLYMREAQLDHVNQMYEMAKNILSYHENIRLLADYIKALSYDIGTYDQASRQLKKLEELLHEVKKQALPKTRDEFETRAILYQMINELKNFLKTKIAFHIEFPEFSHQRK